PRLGEQAHRSVEADHQNIVVLRQRAEFLAVFQVRTETADGGDDHFAVFGMRAEFTRQGKQSQRLVEIDIADRYGFGNRGAFRLLVGIAFAALNVEAVRAFLQRDRHFRFRIEAKLARARAFRAVGILDAEGPGEFALRIIRAADESAEAPELQPQPAGAADRADTRVFAALDRVGEEMLAERLIERVDDVADLEIF